MLALPKKVNGFLSLALVKRSEMQHNAVRFAFPSRQVTYQIIDDQSSRHKSLMGHPTALLVLVKSLRLRYQGGCPLPQLASLSRQGEHITLRKDAPTIAVLSETGPYKHKVVAIRGHIRSVLLIGGLRVDQELISQRRTGSTEPAREDTAAKPILIHNRVSNQKFTISVGDDSGPTLRVILGGIQPETQNLGVGPRH